jgi:hypothetical protein
MHNIKKGYEKNDIWPFNPRAVEDKMGPSQAFFVIDQAQADSSEDEHMDAKDPLVHEILGERIPKSQPEAVQFFVTLEGGGADPREDMAMGSDCDSDGGQGQSVLERCSFQQEQLRQLLELPRIGHPPKRQRGSEVLVDYFKSIILTSDDYIQMMAEKERRKDAVMKEKEAQKLEADRKRMEQQALKARREAEKVQKVADAKALKAFKAQWTPDAIRTVGQELWNTLNAIKAGNPHVGPLKMPPFCGQLPRLCKDNQRY